MPDRRIALVASSYHPYTGGVEEHTRRVARTLRDRGHDVTVWTVDRGEGLGVDVVDGITVRYLSSPLPARSVGAVFRFLLCLPAAALAWVRAFIVDRPEVLHVQCFGPNGVYALALSTLTRTPLLVTGHGETLADDNGVFQKSALIRWALRRAMRVAAGVSACSDFALHDLREHYGLRGGVVTGNGVDLSLPAITHAEQEPPVVLAVGRLEHMKGMDLLVRAFDEAGLASLSRLVIGGDGTARSSLESDVAARGLTGRVSFTGRLEPADVAREMANASVIVVPSRREAFGIVALEAWRAGAPLVATNRGGTVEFVREGVDGLLVDPEDTNALGHAVRRVLEDPSLARRLAHAGSLAVRDFSWERVAEKYESMVEEGVT
jgi:glycosyltransferase involved in cell wall biosynthesis